ncbi:unnamed protein product [Rotaria sp. Silwood1]|nr:unnamed protein product [Rotaria sp. Silwood1]CAF1465311.1 unnamed protein product [Rotaria sp. Silwood1]CAF3636830.1 unnamed protein product [Rotaria sp. Silwood1]CAF3771906.1 unnamed protein product [Rotaria sp. Silwood1]CAF4707288.1 unnamed protein product [Rotaria sp. Silwood1]
MTSSTHVSSSTANVDTALSLKDNLEISWLDGHICENGQHNQLKSYCQNISKLISKWHFFESTDQLQRYLARNPNIKLITIMSGRYARQILALVSPMENLHSAYVLTIDIEKNKKKLGVEPKLKEIFNDEYVLLGRLQKDLSELFWEEGKKLAAAKRDQEARVYFEEAHRLDENLK